MQKAGITTKYSRAWLIARRYQIEKYSPQLIKDLPQLPKEDAEGRFKHGKVFHADRMSSLLSWGEIMVRHACTEGYVRACFELAGVEKSRGLRVGKGGNFLYKDPTLYLDNRKAEGAQIPVDLKGRPMVEQLLNFKAKDGDSVSATKGRAISKIVKAQALRDDAATPAEQKASIDEQIVALMEKYGITVAEVTAWKAARKAKGKAA
jgi:hypothetical protein